jgi:hypothetical protein
MYTYRHTHSHTYWNAVLKSVVCKRKWVWRSANIKVPPCSITHIPFHMWTYTGNRTLICYWITTQNCTKGSGLRCRNHSESYGGEIRTSPCVGLEISTLITQRDVAECRGGGRVSQNRRALEGYRNTKKRATFQQVFLPRRRSSFQRQQYVEFVYNSVSAQEIL